MKTVVLITIGGLLVVGLLGAFISAFALTHVDHYYVSSHRTGTISSVTCAWAHWTGWHSDEISYCSDDAAKVIEWVAKANAALK